MNTFNLENQSFDTNESNASQFDVQTHFLQWQILNYFLEAQSS